MCFLTLKLIINAFIAYELFYMCFILDLCDSVCHNEYMDSDTNEITEQFVEEVTALKEKASEHEVATMKMQTAILDLGIRRRGARDILKFIGSRERSSEVTDINQLITRMKGSPNNFSVDRADVIETFRVFNECGVGRLGRHGSRHKFYWVYWPFISIEENPLNSTLHLVPLKKLKADKHGFSKANKYKPSLMANAKYGFENMNLFPIAENNSDAKTPLHLLSVFSVNDLLAEVQRRFDSLKPKTGQEE